MPNRSNAGRRARCCAAFEVKLARPLAARVSGPGLGMGVWRPGSAHPSGRWMADARKIVPRRLDLDCESDMLFSECRAALGLTRPARLASHPSIASPVAFGCLPPCILVPPDWDDWPREHRRACLLHELAHLAHSDDWAKLAQELISAVFFFHPLVRWLLARLDRERELLCDEAVVALGTEPAGYAAASRPGQTPWADSVCVRGRPAPPGLLPFLDRRTVAIRISRLLEDEIALNTLSPITPPFPDPRQRRRGCGAGRDGDSSSPPRAPREVETSPSGDDRTNAPPASSRKIEGVILDPDGKPVAGTIIVAGINEPGKPNHQVFQTDQDGRFNWAIPERPVSAYFVAY